MPIEFRCPHCGAESIVEDQYAGKSGPCRECLATVVVPFPQPASAGRVASVGESIVSSMIIASALFGTTGILCYLLPTLRLAVFTQSWAMLMLPAAGVFGLTVVGALISGVYYAAVTSLLADQPRASRAAMLGGMFGYIGGAILAGLGMNLWLWQSGGWVLVIAKLVQSTGVTAVGGAATGMLSSLICGMALFDNHFEAPATAPAPEPAGRPVRVAGRNADDFQQVLATRLPGREQGSSTSSADSNPPAQQ